MSALEAFKNCFVLGFSTRGPELKGIPDVAVSVGFFSKGGQEGRRGRARQQMKQRESGV